MQTLVPREDIANAIALNAVQQQSSTIFWPTLAGGLIGVIGVGTTISLSGGIALFGALAILMVRIKDDGPRPQRTSVVSDLAEGARYVRATPPIRELLLLSFTVGSFGVAFHSLAPGFAREVMDMSAGEAGIFLASRGIGAIVASIVMVGIDGGSRLTRLGFGFAVWAASMFLVAANPLYISAIVLMIFHGAALSALTIAGQTLFQTRVPPALLGRVISLWSLATGVGFVITLPVGLLGDEFGLRWTLLAFSGVLTVWAILVGLRPARDKKPAEQSTAEVETAVPQPQTGSAGGS